MAIPQFRNLNELATYLGSLENRIVALESENASLKHYIQDLGGDATKMLPKTNLISSSFLARAFAIWGHYFVAQLIIGLVVMCLSLILGFLLGGSSTFSILSQIGSYIP